MATVDYDLIVIGGGSGGLTATTIAARLGARVLLVDKTRLGGDCLHDGCVPSKALIASARLAHLARRAREFGLAAMEVKPDIAAVMERIRSIQATIAVHDSAAAIERLGAVVRFGGARFLDAHTIEIGGPDAGPEAGRRVTGAHFIVATGSRAAPPPVEGLVEAGFLDHRSVFAISSLPRRLAVLGGGPIGVELGQALSRLGADVTILQRGPRLLPREEPEVSAYLTERLRKEGLDVRLDTKVLRVERRSDEKIVTCAHEDHEHTLFVDEILVAVGRRPVLTELHLEAAGVASNERGIVVDDHLRTSQPHIYAVGDCAGGPQFTHWAEHEARVATRNALFLGSDTRSMDVLPWVTFTDPEVARVGLTLEEAKKKHADAHAHRFAFDHLDRALTEGEPGGFIEVVVDKAERVLGAHIIGHAAGEALCEWVLAMEHGIKLPAIASAIHAYPTMTRINRRVADMHFIDHGVPSWLVTLTARFKAR